MTSTTRLCRKILRELRKSNDRNVVDHIWQYVASEVRRHSLCTGTNVLHQQQRLLNTYLSYIHSSRIHRELLAHYQSRGERSVEESARLVGLELPKSGT